eukprot:TRINITY_DN76519_c0_g1_i1.p1 TRINITY_DN76519_c0_g1~~TRINITY_DN76519_c0_g1_i1.p1  ORF type:complete len:866 (+),score=157.64 TRINITY_DN76519_c0_g1_i1:29-2599(+)
MLMLSPAAALGPAHWELPRCSRLQLADRPCRVERSTWRKALPCATASAAAVAATLVGNAKIRRRKRYCRRCVMRCLAPEAAVDDHAPLLCEAWEKALHGREGSVWTEPQLFAEILESLNTPEKGPGPVHFECISAASESDRDILLYVPGVDFAGAFAAQQFRGLASDFELWRCFVGPEDRTSFSRLTDCLESWIRGKAGESGRRVVLLGESFGGLLSLALALRLGKQVLGGLVLVNPATSFGRTVWPLLGRALTAIPEAASLPPWAHHGDLAELFEDLNSRAMQSPYPYLGSSALTAAVADGTQLGRIAARIATQLLDDSSQGGSGGVDPLVEGFLMYPENLAKLLPPDTVSFRLRHWLRDGCELVDCELRRRKGQSFAGNSLPPTLLLASDGDRLLESAREAERLGPLLAERCGAKLLQVVPLKEAGHSPLDERVDLAAMIKASPIYESPNRKDYVGDYVPPTLETLEEGSKNIEPIATLVSPVFCSWDKESGSRRLGLEGVPDPADLGRPVIFVGNHQLLALDLGPLVREFLIEKGFAPRGLAHPLNFPDVVADIIASSSSSNPVERQGWLDSVRLPFELRAVANALQQGAMSSGTSQSSVPFRVRARQAAAGAGSESLGVGENFGLGGAFAKWGAVPVTPRNFFKLLQRKEAVLLFPGGAREACHGQGEKYKLFWPEQTDFVRVAARFDAVVVPFGSIGSADNVRASRRSQDQNQSENPLNFEGGGLLPVSESLREPPRFPNVAPRLPPASQAAPGIGDRFYYSFGEPVDLQGLDPKDKAGCDSVYQKLKGDVETEIRWLLEARVRDPNRDFLRRQLLEQVLNLDPVPRQVKAGPLKGGVVRSCGRRAPTFQL